MSVEQETSAPASKASKAAGPERMTRDEIHPFLKEQAGKRLVPGAEFHPAREGGSYKGPVLYADKNYIVQGVGKDKDSAVVHKRSDLELVTSNLKWREENNRLGSTPIQVHYKGEKGVPSQSAQVYNWNPEREQAEKAQAKAQAFAKGITDPAEREAFLKNTEAMLRKTVGPDKDAPAAAKEKSAAAPAKAKSEPAKDKATPEAKPKAKAPKKSADKSGPER